MSGVFLVVWGVLAIAPIDRATWWLENVLIFAAVAALIVIRNVLPLSFPSCVLIFGFLTIHTIGAHYTYSLVPIAEVTDWLGSGRNHYDRLVHFCYGLCLVLPLRELLMLHAKVRGFWSYFLPLDLVMSTSLLYELLEWAAAILFGGGLGATFLGTQGDEWDAHQDMLMAAAGGLVATLLIWWRNRRWQSDMTLDWFRHIGRAR
jgi:putative membrane protein